VQAEDGIRDFHVTGVQRVLFRSFHVIAEKAVQDERDPTKLREPRSVEEIRDAVKNRKVHIIFLGAENGWPQFQHLSQNHFPLQRSEEHTSELQSRENLVCRLLLE